MKCRALNMSGLNVQSIVIPGLALILISQTDLSTAHAHEGHVHEPVKVADEEAHRPSAIPDRIILTWSGDPATTQSVTWRTDDSVARGLAEIAVAEDGPNFVSKSKSVIAETTSFKSNLGMAHYHSLTFSNLQPKTMYVYRVGDGVNWSEWSHFTTASHEPQPFSFVYFGDAQNNVKSLWSRVVREAYSDAPKAAFMLHAGDLINQANNDAEWGEWFYAGGWINRSIPSIATPGNHEYSRRRGEGSLLPKNMLTAHWRPTFAFPENGPEGLEESVYWIDYQGARIISLNSNERQKEQIPWLEQVLTENPQPWTIITFHHPIYSAKAGRDNPEQRALWQPIFDKYRVDLVLQGHDHTYARTGQMAYNNVPEGAANRSPKAGTVYVVSVSGPKMYDLGRRPFMKRVAEDTQLYQIVTVDGAKLRYEARIATGRLYDAFTLNKRIGQTNELIEQVPDAPERRRNAKAASLR